MEKPDFPEVIDSTIRKALKGCYMRGYYGYFMHLKPKGKSIHLHFGGALARAVEVFRKSYYGSQQLPVDKAYAAGLTALLEFWGDDDDSISDHATKNLQSCVLAYDDFFREYSPTEHPIRPLMVKGEPAVEFSFAVPIPDLIHPQTGHPILYAGKFDMLARYNDSIYVNDEKTAGSLSSQWANSFQLASQFTGYCWGAKQFGHNVQGIIVRGIQPLKNPPFIKHQLLIEQRPQWMIDRWLIQLKRDIKQAIYFWENDIEDYALDEACAAYGGCPYLTLCTSPNPKPWIATHYEVRPWSPLTGEAETVE